MKTAICKHAATHGSQWDRYLRGILFVYRNIPHDSTGEKPSYLLFGVDCRTPTDAEFLNPTVLQLTDVQDYREELSLSLASARDIAAKAVQAAQRRYKKQYDRKATPVTYRVGDWVLIKFPADESGKMRKLSRPWHGPYRITEVNGPNVSASKVYNPQKEGIKVHQSRVKHCPADFPAGFYWYGGKSKGPGRPPKWVEQLLAGKDSSKEVVVNTADIAKADTASGDLPTRNKSVDMGSGENPTDVMEKCARVPVATSDSKPRGRNAHYGLRQCPRRNKKWIS